MNVRTPSDIDNSDTNPGKVVTYKLTPEEIAERYGPATTSQVNKEHERNFVDYKVKRAIRERRRKGR